MDWTPYIQSIAKAVSREVGSLYRAQHFHTPETILYMYKSTIRPCMEYCSHSWGGAPRSHGQKMVVCLVGSGLSSDLQALPHRRMLLASACSTSITTGNVPLSLWILYLPNVSLLKALVFSGTTFYQSSFFPRTAALWNSITNKCFLTDNDLTAFKGRVNKFLLLK